MRLPCVLRSAGDDIVLSVTADRSEIRADDTDLAYVDIVLQDGAGNLASHLDRAVSVTVEGPGVLAGLGSAKPSSEERFDASTRTTYDGRALAIVRPTGVGEITVTVSAEGLDGAAVVIRASSYTAAEITA